jgi:ABC-2 type transport system ATP-binding protein
LTGGVLSLDGLTKRFGDVVALDGCRFSVPRGQMLGFLGPNGAGKTTAMRAVFGLLALDDGRVMWDDRPIDRAARLHFGYMPEERGLYPRMTVIDQVVYFGRLHGMDRAAADRSARALLAHLGLGERLQHRVQDLSHGNQQRVQLAVALVHDPELLVLDEPFSGLDPVAAETMAAVLRNRATGGAAVLFSSHQLDVVEHLCQDVAIIDEGRIVLAGRVADLRAASPHRHVSVVVRNGGAAWAERIPNAIIRSSNGDRVTLEVDRGTDPATILDVARRAGEVIEFAFVPPSLSTVFREAVQG